MRGAHPHIRPAAVAGQFYPAGREQLRQAVADLLAEAAADAPPRREVAGIMVPHAGYVFSGACAASVFARVAVPASVVILCPNHTGAVGRGLGASLWRAGGFETPLGVVAIDEDLAADLLSACPLLADDPAAHAREHAIEVELPFLQVVAPGARMVPIVVAWDDWARCAELGRTMAAVLAAVSSRPLLIASSDMTHFESAASARHRDRLALEAIGRLDGEGLMRVCHAHRISMCGRAPAAVVCEAARLLGARRGELVDYRHSGMVTGDDSSVVAYAGMVVE